MNEKRIASMDVLRIVLTIFVITLHFNNSMGGGEVTFCAIEKIEIL